MSHNSAKYSKIGGSQEDASHDCTHSILFGSINATMCIPVMISFTSIIFRDDAFRQVLPSLIKIVLFSCMVHQISFTVFSGLKFAVGQVQDAGLIFLSAMASSIVASNPNRLGLLSRWTRKLFLSPNYFFNLLTPPSKINCTFRSS